MHISTDEVYGSLGESGYFTEESPVQPSSPYSASKTASDLMVLAYYHTFKLPVVVTRCSNNYGPYQFPRSRSRSWWKSPLAHQPLPVRGDGLNVRDWLLVEDHCDAIDLVLHQGRVGEVYDVRKASPGYGYGVTIRFTMGGGKAQLLYIPRGWRMVRPIPGRRARL